MDITIKEAKEKIEELDINIRRLEGEKRKYTEYIFDKENKSLYDIRKTYEGKYFIQKTKPRKFDYVLIKAFKIIEVSKGNKYYAKCLALIEDDTPAIQDTVGIIKTNLGLWSRNTNDIVYNKSIPYILDCYEEINKEEFVELYKKQTNILDECI